MWHDPLMPGSPLDRRDAQPLYEQLADDLRRRIETGEIPPRTAIPSKRVLTEDYGISGKTIDAATAILKEEDLIRLSPGRGLFVVPEEDRRPRRR